MKSELQTVESGEIIFYQPDGESKLQVFLEKDTVWLTQAQMGELFKRERSVIAKHIANAFKEEIEENSNVQILHNTLSKFKPTTLYSLDVIISVGYRVKSVRGTQFRRWANQVLKDRFIIVDDTIYHVGASIRDLGNKLTAFSVLSAVTKEQLLSNVR